VGPEGRRSGHMRRRTAKSWTGDGRDGMEEEDYHGLCAPPRDNGSFSN
jgi:hypothetical protein